MKKRKGFVSNSSSASYIVEIRDIKESTFFGLLQTAGYAWDELSLNGIKHFISERIKEYKQHIEENKGSNKDMLGFYERHLKSLETSQKEVMAVDEDDIEESIKYILKFNGIMYKWTDGDIELGDFTSMHNSYRDGVSPLLQEILLYFMFETDYKIKCRAEHD